MQTGLFHDNINDALREDVAACGGNKAVGSALWPDLPTEQAAGKLRDCLNADRREHLTPTQVQFVIRTARNNGSYAAMNHLARECGFAEPQPVQEAEQRDQLQREFVEATKALMAMANRIEIITARAGK